jgi:hypothetical protein
MDLDIINLINNGDLLYYENLKTYVYHLCANKLYIDQYNHNENSKLFKNEKTYYWIFDAPGESALGHWIYESFIFVHILIGLNKQIKNIKILTRNNCKYVKNILNFFNIENEIVNEINNYNNVCFFPKVYSLNTTPTQIECDEYYNKHLNLYIQYIQSNLQIVKKIKSLFLPRNDTDNYKENDRIINNTDNIKKIVIQNGGMVLDTYRLNNINYQFTIVNNADIIILDYGSSFHFNCIFLKNKKIYVLDDKNLYTEQMAYENVRLLNKKIADNNDVKMITTHNLSLIEDITK